MKKITLLILLSGYAVVVYAQLDSMAIRKTTGRPDSLSLEETIYNHVYKNVAAFYIKYNNDARNEIGKNGYLKYNGIDLFDICLPDKGYTLDMVIKKLDWAYPVKGYTVYQVKLNGLRFTNDKIGLVRIHSVYDGPTTSPDNYYLLIVHNADKEIKFVSGNYFLNDISTDFKLDKDNPGSYTEYLAYKTFQFQTKDIEFIKSKGKHLYYKAYSGELASKVIIEMNSVRLDPIKITKEKD